MNPIRLDWVARPGRPLRGSLRVPGDKSVSHRAIMLGALAEGITRISGFLEGEDTRATAQVFRQLGVRIETPSANERIVHGVGLGGLKGSNAPLDCGNAGTGMRLLAGVLAGQSFDSVLVGDASLSKRPMRRVIEPLERMGAVIGSEAGGVPPLRIQGGCRLRGLDYTLPVASAQVKSALLLAGLYADGETVVREPHPTRDYSERMLAAFGWPIEFSPGFARLSGGHRLHGRDVAVPADFSSAAFFLVAASIVPGSELRLEAVGMNPRRTGLLTALRRMGADIREENAAEQGGEPVADLVVRHAPLHGIEIEGELVPDMIDEFPVLFVAAACAQGVTVIRDASELRVKESDRIAAMAGGLRVLGLEVEEHPDGATIVPGRMSGGTIDSRGDHRIAMSFAVAAQRADGDVRIGDIANVATSFPGFEALARRVGMQVDTGNEIAASSRS
ncbi:3-phosphoshikimate 1-carboxyvinyltransferase [Lysobacter niastensis]|uniref:3-phosphoshikimate 1-carboxyvinyltransferase n=1 Tax=Lysobacter niastensis TaxID=380629 RepID=A0ABU1WDY8_9GAMM|nr:3-phosphoshikimate 1-carboxyvinyltransferase [Lysobacter niastensis]MDR7135824.1 3-phosphoshikimate 1-carboxyvinyltransferase [Lysobacter niastensis]